ncbi:MAG: peptidase S41 [Bacteroidetes bacterium 24-39-8]|jgi:Tol biopolymer transport system component|nr:MAG: peptidase S41 [Sphingobacteriia bacterium 35-40-8]OYZ48145.1 MAG: peptidase S41 [Bacteroidetes bacterium 24-39-8]OZA68828.1 MAG: peptidase S41 [Sphingobacteriia bacterium 39-39-8]HQR93507.1 S41 family peptidase [Sediminibacterium sp.]HQS55821.1 S41 family peptidase [Sediminibacterium sp.]
MRKVFLFLLLVGVAATAMTQSNAAWLRYPTISPDGKTIAFGYKGDIYRVDVNGGVAVPLTIHEAQDMMPVWSHDGKSIAFASDRYGNFDVFVIPASGGTPTRITYNSAADYPYDFSVDNKQIIFGSGRNVQSSNLRFYSPRLFQNLYTVSVSGGTPILVSGAGMDRAHYNSKGTQIVFEDRKGYEDPWRKHHTSSVTRDIWVMDLASSKYRKISGFEGEDREPVFSSDDQYVYYLSEKNGNQNIYKTPLLAKIAEQQLTSFKNNPVRHLSISTTNTLCFTQDGEIYTLQNGGSPKKIAVQIYNDGRQNVEKNVAVNGNVGEFSLSPNGKEIAFITRGEVFVTSVEGGQTKRITNTPQQERMIEWSADGKTLIYAAERNDNWDIYTTSILRKEESYFYAATVLKETPLIATNAEEFLPKFSPDGKEVAYLENRNVLKVFNIASKQSRTIIPKGHNYSYRDGDLDFNWSPDGKYILTDDEYFGFGGSHAAIIKADGSGTIEHPINSGFGEDNPKWAMDGKLMTWANNREGRRSIAFQGNREVDIYGAFLDQAAYDQFKLSKEDFALLKEKMAGEKKDSSAKKWSPDFTDIENRKVRLTINSSSISDYAISPDGSKIYYLASFEKGYDLWVTEPRTRETKILAKLGGSPSGIEMSKDGKTIFVTNNGSLLKVDESGKASPIGVSSEMVLDAAKERAYIFEHCWRQVRDKFYDPTIHGIDWKMYKETYAKFLPHISNNYDFQELLSEMLGELNGSHTGGRYSPQMLNPDATAALGLLYDETYTGNGLKVTEVIAGGPVAKANSNIKPGSIIEKIDGETLVNTSDWAKYLNRKVGKRTLLSVLDSKTNTRFEEIVKPIAFAEESALMYKRWTTLMHQLVDKLSGGKVGYVHVQGMNDGSYRTTIDEVMGRNKQKEALIVDTRFNGGGWLHNDLNTFLSGKQYLGFAPQGNPVKPTEPMDRWSKPSCVVMSEGNYSDAFIFPYVYKDNGIGKIIGMPVPGTGTAVWWETQIDPTIVFGIPMIATIGKEKRPTENLQLEPDMKVPLPYEEFLNGKDPQIEAAVKEMLKTIGK